MTTDSYKPKDWPNVMPYFMVKDAEAFKNFLHTTFEGTDLDLIYSDDKKLQHAEFKLGNSIIMYSENHDENDQLKFSHYVYVPDVDKTFEKIVEQKLDIIQMPEDQYYGERSGGFKDAFGNVWWVGTHKTTS